MSEFDRHDPRSEYAKKLNERIADWHSAATVGGGVVIGILAGWECGVLSAVIVAILGEIGIQIWENHRYL